MACFMERCNAFFLIRDNTATLLGTNSNLHKGFLDITLVDICPVIPCCSDCSLVEKVLKVSSCKARGGLCNLLQIHIIPKRLVFSMNIEDFFSASYIRSSNMNLSVKSTRSHNSRIQNIHSVGSSHYNDALIDTKTIHLYKHLIQCLFTLIVSAAHTCSTFSGHCINLINKYNTRRILLGVLKKVSNSGCTYTHEHLYEIRS